MKIKEISSSANQLEALQSASKPLSPEQARVRAMKQGIDRHKEALARKRERQQKVKYVQKCKSPKFFFFQLAYSCRSVGCGFMGFQLSIS
jgi:hypothetical protein